MKKVQIWQQGKAKRDCSNCSSILPGSPRQAVPEPAWMTAVYLQERLILFENRGLFYIGDLAVCISLLDSVRVPCFMFCFVLCVSLQNSC